MSDHAGFERLLEREYEKLKATSDTARPVGNNQLSADADQRTAGSLNTKRLSDIKAKPISWLWPRRIARGKLTIVAGDPGLGKTQVAASIASIVTKGGLWPVEGGRCPIGSVLFFSAEDDAADTLRPRLEAAGADLARVHVVESVIAGYTGEGNATPRFFSLQRDLAALEQKLVELMDVALVVIDPISAFLGEGIDSHKNSEVRGLLAPLSELAARHNAAFTGISHLSKSGGAPALMRVMGSLAFVAAARAAYLVTADAQDSTRRLLLGLKNNLAPDTSGLAFRIEPVSISSTDGPIETSRVVWDSEPVCITADEAIQAASTPEKPSRLMEAADWLCARLATGAVLKTELLDSALTAGIKEKTLNRASKLLDVRKGKDGMDSPWWWSLPPKVANSAEDGQDSDMANFGEFGQLREIDT